MEAGAGTGVFLFVCCIVGNYVNNNKCTERKIKLNYPFKRNNVRISYNREINSNC